MAGHLGDGVYQHAGYTGTMALRLRTLTVDPPLVLAPMAGITDSPFRQIIRGLGGCGLVTSEFISSEALARRVRGELAKLRFDVSERPLTIQIYGANPAVMAAAARLVEETGADVCDVNMGCPARKILKGSAGAALMDDLLLARRVVTAVRASVSIPVTVKLRSGPRADILNDLELATICEGEGADAVTLHPRPASQLYHGAADWTRIARLKQNLRIPVIGNGDVHTADDSVRMLQETGCDAVMIGRAALANPWIFSESAATLIGGSVATPGAEQRLSSLQRYASLLEGAYDKRAQLHRLRLFARGYSQGIAGGRQLRLRLSSVRAPSELLELLERFLLSEGVTRPASA